MSLLIGMTFKIASSFKKCNCNIFFLVKYERKKLLKLTFSVNAQTRVFQTHTERDKLESRFYYYIHNILSVDGKFVSCDCYDTQISAQNYNNHGFLDSLFFI